MPDALTAPPSALASRGRGRRFWRAVLVENELRADEVELLAECCRMLDLLDNLRAAGSPLVVDGKMHPAIVETRQVRMELRRTLAQLCFPDPEAGEELSPKVATMRSHRARKAARARWSHGT